MVGSASYTRRVVPLSSVRIERVAVVDHERRHLGEQLHERGLLRLHVSRARPLGHRPHADRELVTVDGVRPVELVARCRARDRVLRERERRRLGDRRDGVARPVRVLREHPAGAGQRCFARQRGRTAFRRDVAVVAARRKGQAARPGTAQSRSDDGTWASSSLGVSPVSPTERTKERPGTPPVASTA